MDLTHAHVLVVEDEAYSRQLLHSMLYQIGVRQIKLLESVNDAYEYAIQKSPNLIVCDYTLKGGTAFDLADKIRQFRTKREKDIKAQNLAMAEEHDLVKRVAADLLGVEFENKAMHLLQPFPKIPLIMLSAQVTLNLVETARKFGIECFISKPLRTVDLEHRVKSLLLPEEEMPDETEALDEKKPKEE